MANIAGLQIRRGDINLDGSPPENNRYVADTRTESLARRISAIAVRLSSTPFSISVADPDSCGNQSQPAFVPRVTFEDGSNAAVLVNRAFTPVGFRGRGACVAVPDCPYFRKDNGELGEPHSWEISLRGELLSGSTEGYPTDTVWGYALK